MAKFSYQDLNVRGLTLVLPDRYEFAPMLDDVRWRYDTENPLPPAYPREPIPDDLTFAAILVNHGEKPVAALAVEWKFEETGGQRYSHQFTTTFGQDFLLPPGVRPDRAASSAFWFTILPGSKRLLAESKIFGYNTDVRAPRSDEVWRGAIGAGSFTKGTSPSIGAVLELCLLVLDGVFFSDGEFLGPNQMHLWEHVYYNVEVNLEAAQIAAQGKREARSAEEIVAEVDRFTVLPPN